MKKILPLALFIPVIAVAVSVDDDLKQEQDWRRKIQSVPDSLFRDVKKEDLLVDEVYVKLARDGWSQDEIKAIMGDYVKRNRSKVRGSNEYGRYAKQWLPTYGYTPGGDTIYQFVDTTYSEKLIHSVRSAMPLEGTDGFDNYLAEESYSPEPRLRGERKPGLFRAAKPIPSSGRIHWIQVHPDNPDKLMVIPDGAGIARTEDGGKHWEFVTDRIPRRDHRNTATHSAIPVDPDDWDHFFAFMSNGNPVYETFDGGKTWELVPGATHKGFKRGHAFRDSKGDLKFIGAVQNGGSSYWASTLWLSEDKGVTWTQVVLPDSLKDVRPETGVEGAWFQEIAFDPSDRDKIYLPTSRAIYYFDDGARPVTENGKKTYRIKKMHFKVFNADSTELRSEGVNFPFPATTQAFLNVNPNNPKEMWFATGARNTSIGTYSALYRTRDGGKTWITLQEPYAKIGSGNLFGNEAPWGWLGGFGVNYADPSFLYGCSMSSAISNDGGTTFKEYAWGNRMTYLHDDGIYYSVSNSRHNADNHCIISHKSGRVFRGSDGGMLMVDKNINSNKWTNIGNDMGQMLYYSAKVNEFGDQLIMGNTQDIDVQTYREGRWGAWRGYEGSTAFVNPYSGMCYYPSGGGGVDGLNYSSWQASDTWADVCTGNWYVKQGNNLYIVEDFGKKSRQVEVVGSSGDLQYVNSVGLSRTAEKAGASTLWVRTGGSWFRYSQDNAKTFCNAYQVSAVTNVQTFAADPDNWKRLYIVNKEGSRMKVLLVDMIEKKVLKDMTYNLPDNLSCTALYLHEGSGDLYYYSSDTGLYLLTNGSTEWRYWTKGYNLAKSRGVIINYTTQEMVLYDYGRGIYVADLEHPSDRYFSKGFSLKELSHVDGRRTLGIDTEWTIPMYYNYKWTVNGEDVGCPYQYLTASLHEGDRVQLELTLRESPDVKTLSEIYVVAQSADIPLEKVAGNVLYSDGNGRVDLGYVDYFLNDFTIELWVNPSSSNGVILANGQRVQTRGGRGWWLGMDNGTLKFNYAPTHRFSQPTYEKSMTQEATLSAGTLPLNEWSHVAVTQQRDGSIAIYVNGMKKTESVRIRPEHPLNNAVYLSLFADGYEESPWKGSVDELKIWNYAMNNDDVRSVMYSHRASRPEALVYYNGFNGSSLSDDAECFSKHVPAPRILAETSSRQADIPVGAEYEADGILEQTTDFTDGKTKLMKISRQSDVAGETCRLFVFGYDDNFLKEANSNLHPDYYEVLPISYLIQPFEGYKEDETVNVTFYTDAASKDKTYQVYVSSAESQASFWKSLGKVAPNEDGGLVLSGVPLASLTGQRIILASLNRGIEIVPDSAYLNAEGQIEICSAETMEVPYKAYLRGREAEPTSSYTIVSSDASVEIVGDLHFVKGVAEGMLRINSRNLKEYNQHVSVVLAGKDDKAVPYTLQLVNRILPDKVGEAIAANGGGLFVGSGATFAPLNGSNTMTLMTWVRFDDAAALTGTKGVMMFRSASGATGLHLQNGNVRCHWNEESWSWGYATNLNLTQKDLGRWVHLAMVVRPDGIDYYLNGQRHTYTRSMSKTRISTELMLGLTTSTEKWFKGAFDQLMVWNRSLTQEEVLQYMHRGVRMDDDGLLAFANMDYYDKNDEPKELLSEVSIRSNGTMSKHQASEIPYNPVSSILHTPSSDPDDIWKLACNGKSLSYSISCFNTYPYNYVSEARSLSMPLVKESYVVAWSEQPAFAENDNISMTYSHSSVLAGDSLAVGVRSLGSTQPFTTFYTAKAETAGKVVFTIPAVAIEGAVELMVMTTADAAQRPVKVSLSLKEVEQRPLDRFLLKENETVIPVYVKLLSGTNNREATVYVKETAYVSADAVQIDPTSDGVSFNLHLHPENMNKKGWNPVTVNLLGVDSEPLEMNVALAPKVVLHLTEGDGLTWVANEAVTTLPIEAELVQGIFDNDVELEIVADVPGVLNGASGDLFANRKVEYPELEFYGAQEPLDDGWNLVGNPYMADINLTKRQNYEAQNISKFIYKYDNVRNNYVVADMTTYEADKLIAPFTSYFIQALETGASFAVKPEAKSRSLNRRVYDYDIAAEQTALVFELYENDKLIDETKLQWEDDASEDVVVNEDAPKMWSMAEDASQLYSLAGQKALAVNVLPLQSMDVKLGVMAGKPGTFKLKVKRMSGFDDADRITLYDAGSQKEILICQDTEHFFSMTEPKNMDERFVVRLKRPETGVETVKVGYPVKVMGRQCIISQLKGNADIRIFDPSGKTIHNNHVSTDEYKVTLQPGYYIVNIRENNKEYVVKIVVR